MVRAFSLTSDSLSYFIGWTLVHADRAVIVSPWLSDVELRFPVNEHLDSRQTNLLEAIETLPDTDVTFIVRTGESHNDFVQNRLPEDVSMLTVDDLHAKVVVCDEYAYLGSANITHGGLTLNREICEVIENEYGDTDTYLNEELDIRL
ncbi:phospholipase D-like domain-containing protein [Haloarchaeobius litoreus]|uniref:Phospholipase D-like domain-containing protein n=1 Tax=Haloarchaeobius litoreus TaxID=755306 RepID=A0ABD6DKK8_9EURY|nr:phospholipase D-like domain-containing protein [Haloarchaeobius litoreus]